MLRARQNDVLIDLTKISSQQLPHLKLTKHFSCPYCGAPVILRQGSKRRAHFAHQTPCRFGEHESESEAHLMSKEILREWLIDCGAKKVEVEYRLPSGNRIADLYFEWDGKAYAFEIQKSMMSPEVFQQRISDYRHARVEVIWIFIGELNRLKTTYRVNRVMRLQKEQPLIHLNWRERKVTIFNQIVWMNQREIEAIRKTFSLDQLTIQQVVEDDQLRINRRLEDWLALKKDFRCHKFAAYQRKEYALLRLCAPFLINLSLLPSVIGWPIEGAVYTKPLFIWQAYVVLCIMSEYKEQDVFTLSDIQKKLKGLYRLKEGPHCLVGLKCYLDLLVHFGMLKSQFGYFEYVKRPRLYAQLDPYLIEDAQLGERWKQIKDFS